MARCPCCSGLPYDECCGPFHDGEKVAPTAEALMRSRFSAFARENETYLLATWHRHTRPKKVIFDSRMRWLRLEVLGTTAGSLFDNAGTVLFEAHFRDAGQPGVMRENSTFTRPRKFALAALGALAIAVPLITVNATAAETLLSQGKPATSSSSESSSFTAAKAVDGNSSTRWASAEGHDPEWIRVDLGTSYTISHVNLSWEAAYAKSYQVQTSADGAAWSTIYSTTTGNGGSDDLTGLTGNGRYVRVYGTARGTSYGYSLFEFKVYGSGVAPSPSATASATASPTPSPTGSAHVDLSNPVKKDIAMQIVSSAENSTLNWKAQYKYIEDIGDGRGYTAGIIGFCSGTGDMLDLVELYTARVPGNILAKYLPALRNVDGTSSHAGLDPNYTRDWATAASDSAFKKAQDDERDRVYFNPAVAQAKADGLWALGQFIYYDAIVMHGDGGDPESFSSIRANALKKAKPPSQGGNQTTYLHAFLDARKIAMQAEAAHSDTSRVDTAQRVFLNNGNLDLNTPLSWKVYGDPFSIA